MEPAVTVTLAGVVALVLLEESETRAPPLGAALVSVTVPCDVLPPTTDVGLTLRADKLAGAGGGGAAWTVIRRADEKGPATPAELMPRTRQKSCWAGKLLIVACDTLTVWLSVSGVVKLFESSI